MKNLRKTAIYLTAFILLSSCEKKDEEPMVYDPDTAQKVSVDRFSADFAHLFLRTDDNGMPEPNEPINFDKPPFITKGLGPGGEKIQYYNFDVLPIKSAPIFVLFKEGEEMPVEGQLNIIDVIPGDAGYNDFWHVHKVTVPSDYVANTIASVDELMSKDYTIERTNIIVNCPVVPEGSTAMLRYSADESNGLVKGWYKNMLVHYFSFEEKDLRVDIPAEGHPEVPLSDILVTFNINPGMDGGGPPSGFVTETGTMQTHNVTETIPTDADYSPLWDVDIYDNMDFENVSNWSTASSANVLATGAAIVNCPVVSVE